VIDADGCPVIRETLKLSKKYKIACTLVSDINHQLKDDYAEIITVDKGIDAADFKILSLIKKGDILITQDYGLASLALPKGSYVLNQNGVFYDENTIDQLLLNRHLAKQMRKSGQRTKGPSKRKKADNAAFEKILNDFISDLLK
jgi:hypothetical protein